MDKDSVNKSIKFAISGVMVITLLGKLMGFAKELILAYFFGVGSVSDAYLISQTIPGTLFQIVGTGISTCFVPIYLRIQINGSKEEKKTFVDKFITIILLLSVFIVGIVLLFTGNVVKLFAMGFDAETMSLAIVFTRISVITLFFSGLVYVYTALLQAEKKFFQSAFGVIPYNIGLMLAIVVGAKVHLYAISYLSALAVVAHLIYQIFYVRKLPYHYSLNFKFKDSYIKSTIALLPPVVIGVAATEINTLVDRTLASSIIVGGITVITYGTSLFNLVVGIFSQSVSLVYYPSISEASIKKDKALLTHTVHKAVEMSIFFLIPITIGIMLLSKQLVQILYGHGYFGEDSASLVADVLRFYAIGFVPYALKQTFNNLFYSNQKTRTPMVNTVIGIIINIVGNVFLARFMGLRGLAFATSLSSISIAILLIFSSKSEIGINPLPSLNVWMKYIVAATVMGVAIKGVNSFVPLGDLLITVISFVLGVSVYFVITHLLRVNIITNRGE